MSYPELLSSALATYGTRYEELITHTPPHIFEQYLVKLSKVTKIINPTMRERELEKGAVNWEMGERLDMNMLNVGEYIIAVTPPPQRQHPSHTGWMLVIPIERNDTMINQARGSRGHIRYIQLGVNRHNEITIIDDGKTLHGIVDNGWGGNRNLYFYKCPMGLEHNPLQQY